MPVLSMTNLTPNPIGLGGAVGTLSGSYRTTERHVSIAELEALRERLVSLSRSGLIVWTVADTSDSDDDAAEGMSYDQMTRVTKILHKGTVTATDATSQPGQGPAPIVLGTVIGLSFDTVTDKVFRLFKINSSFAGDGSGADASFHVHWTKSAAADESGNTVQWRLSYTVFDGRTDEVVDGFTPTVLDFTDTYEDNGTSEYVVYRTSNIQAPGFVAGYYVGLSLEYVPAGTTVTAPTLISADLLLRHYINI